MFGVMNTSRMLRVVSEAVIEVVSIPVMLSIVGVGLVFQALQGVKEGWNDGDEEGNGGAEGGQEAEAADGDGGEGPAEAREGRGEEESKPPVVLA
jgi:hypothetical protein